MPPTKTSATILRVVPYRETSYIVHLFTQQLGLVRGVAKGIRSARKGQAFLERGFLIECLVYVRPGRELHTITSVQVLEFYPKTRAHLARSTVRDAAFELVCSAITIADPHPELFEMLNRFLWSVEKRAEQAVNPFTLWKFYGEFCDIMGVGIELDRCARCGGAVGDGRLYLNMARGGVECERCTRSHHKSATIGSMVWKLLKGEVGEELLATTGERRKVTRVTRLLADYCRYHFGLQGEFKALEFLEKIEPQRPQC